MRIGGYGMKGYGMRDEPMVAIPKSAISITQ